MNICFLNNAYKASLQNSSGGLNSDRRVQNNLSPLASDCVSFGMKKTQLDLFDYACVSRFKAPIEKFKTKADFNVWANDKLNKLFQSEKLTSISNEPSVHEDKNRIISEWKQVLTIDNETCTKNPSVALAVFSDLISGLSRKTDDLPEEYSKNVFDKTLSELKDKLKHNKDNSFNFNSKYKKNLKANYILDEKIKQNINPDSNDMFWIKIPSKTSAPDKFEENVNKLKALSSDFWCTKKGYKARRSLETDDFYICAKNNEAKLGVRLDQGKIFDVQGKLNDFYIPLKHVNVVENLIKDNGFEISSQSRYPESVSRAHKAIETSKTIGESIQKGDYVAVMEHYGMNPKLMDDGLIEISHYDGYPEELNYFKKYGMDEQNFFSTIGKINGDVDFAKTNLENTMNVKEIAGNVNCTDSKLKMFTDVSKIGKNLRLYNSEVDNLGILEEIGGNMNCFGNCKLENLGKLKRIYGNADLSNKQLDYANQLEVVGNRNVIENRLASRR